MDRERDCVADQVSEIDEFVYSFYVQEIIIRLYLKL